MKKEIYAAYEEVKQREISELKNAVRRHGGKYVFTDEMPGVWCDLDGLVDVSITSVELDEDDNLVIIGSPFSPDHIDWEEDEREIPVGDILYGQMWWITSLIPDVEDTDSREIWARVGITLKSNEGEISAMLADNGRDLESVLRKIIGEGRYEINGNSYIPSYAVDDYNETYKTDYPSTEYECNL